MSSAVRGFCFVRKRKCEGRQLSKTPSALRSSPGALATARTSVAIDVDNDTIVKREPIGSQPAR
jgi:hypothetical protein